MDKIIALVGEAGSGTSTIADLLEKEGYNYIRSYTTRKPYYKGEKKHIFVDDEPLWIKKRGLDYYGIVAYKKINGNSYWTTKEQYKNKGVSIYIINPLDIKYLKENVIDAETLIIYLKTDEKVRFDRMLWNAANKFENFQQRHTARNEIRKRIYRDRDSFKIIACDYIVDTTKSIKKTLQNIKSIIN